MAQAYTSILHPRRKSPLSRHHLTPLYRGGKRHPANYIYMWRDKHDVWHFLFERKTLKEIVEDLKKRPIKKLSSQGEKDWQFLFRRNSVSEVYKILFRLMKIKSNQMAKASK